MGAKEEEIQFILHLALVSELKSLPNNNLSHSTHSFQQKQPIRVRHLYSTVIIGW